MQITLNSKLLIFYMYIFITTSNKLLIIPFIIGVIEGITEFLPISSTGHIILLKYFFNYTNDLNQILIIIIQLGVILSILITFWDQLYKINKNCILKIFNKKHHFYPHLCIYHIIIGTIPGILFGAIFHKNIKIIFSNPIYIIYGLIFGSIFLLIGEWSLFQSSKNRISNINHINNYQAFLIGCFQCLSFLPGFSRFGSTIVGGLLVGLNKRIALEFSLILAIPIILGSIILTIYHNKHDINPTNITTLIIGSITAFITSLFFIKTILKLVQKISLIPFAIYRIVLAIIVYWILLHYN